jgi:hypothetical protein
MADPFSEASDLLNIRRARHDLALRRNKEQEAARLAVVLPAYQACHLPLWAGAGSEGADQNNGIDHSAWANELADLGSLLREKGWLDEVVSRLPANEVGRFVVAVLRLGAAGHCDQIARLFRQVEANDDQLVFHALWFALPRAIYSIVEERLPYPDPNPWAEEGPQDIQASFPPGTLASTSPERDAKESTPRAELMNPKEIAIIQAMKDLGATSALARQPASVIAENIPGNYTAADLKRPLKRLKELGMILAAKDCGPNGGYWLTPQAIAFETLKPGAPICPRSAPTRH